MGGPHDPGGATVGRPPTRPRAAGDEAISSRMDSASAAKTWKANRLPAVVVSRADAHSSNYG